MGRRRKGKDVRVSVTAESVAQTVRITPRKVKVVVVAVVVTTAISVAAAVIEAGVVIAAAIVPAVVIAAAIVTAVVIATAAPVVATTVTAEKRNLKVHPQPPAAVTSTTRRCRSQAHSHRATTSF